MNIPNIKSLICGALATTLYSLRMLDGTIQGYVFVAGVLIAGVPIAFLFLMYSNPKQQGSFNIGIVLAFPLCVILLPVIGLTMLVSKPWNNPQWKNRNASELEDESDPPQEKTS